MIYIPINRYVPIDCDCGSVFSFLPPRSALHSESLVCKDCGVVYTKSYPDDKDYHHVATVMSDIRGADLYQIANREDLEIEELYD